MSIVRGKTPPKMSRTEASSTPSIDGSIPDGECNFVSTSADTKTFACSKKTATEEWLDSMSISDISSRIWRRASTGNTVEGLDGTLYLTPESIEQKSSQLRKAPSNDAKSTSTEGFRDYPAPLSDSSEPSSPFISIEGSSLGREALRGSLATAFDSRGPEKRDGLNEITNWFLQWLEKGFKSCGSEQGTSSGAHPRASSGEGAISNRQGPRGLRKRGRNNSDPDDNNGESDDDDGDDKNPKKKPFFQRPIRRFGCPFFKYDPLTHCEYPSCMGRGFPDVHRVKGHLYKCHTPPEFRCFRCYKVFDEEPTLANHCRDATCNKEIPPTRETQGVSKVQLEKLKKRSKNGVSEHARWNEVYLILFPHRSGSILPSPYVDYPVGDVFAGEKSNGSKRWPLLDDPERLERFFLSECPRHLEAELRNRNGGLKNLLNDSSGRSELLELIPKILMRLISDLDEQQESKAETATTMEKAADQAQGDNVDAYPNGEVLLSGTYQSDTSLSKRKEESGGFPSSLNETRPGNSTIAAPLPPTPTNIFESLDWLHQMQESNEDPNDISFEDILNPPGQNSFDDILNTSDQPTFEDFLEASGPNCFGEASDSAEHIESSDFEKHTGAIPSLTRSGSELAPSPPSDMDAYGRFDLGKVEVVEPSSSVQKPIHKGASQVACPYGEDVSAKGKSRNVVSDSFSATVCGADADESLSMGSLD